MNWMYLQFTEEPVDGVLPHGANLAPVQSDPCIGFAVLPLHLLQAHQTFPRLQQHTQDHEAGLHVSLTQTDTK